MADFDPVAAGAQPISTARNVFNSGTTAGAPRGNAGNTKPGAATPFDPVKAGAQEVDDFDPVKSGASLADAADINQKTAADPSYVPNEDELNTLYEDYKNRSLGSKALGVAKGAGQAVTSAFTDAAKAVPEVLQKPDIEQAGRLGATALEGISDAAAGVVKLPYKLVKGPLSYIGHTVQDSFDPQGEDQRAYQRWKDDYLTNLALSRGSNSEAFQQDVLGMQEPFKPLPAASKTLSTGLQLAAAKLPLGASSEAMAAAERLAQASEPTLAKAAMTGGIENAPTLPAQVAGKVGQAVETAGGAAKTVGGLPRAAVRKVAGAVTGPEYADRLAATAEGAALTHVPGVSSLAALETAGAGAQKVGQIVKTIAQTPADGPFGRLVNLGKSVEAPDWLKSLTSMPAVQSVYGAASNALAAGKGFAKGAVKGAATGAGVSLLSGDNPEETGGNIAAFGAFGGLHTAGDAITQQAFQRRAAGVLSLVGQNLADGVAPDTLAKIPDAAMLAAADLPYLGIKDAQGRDLKVRFSNAADMGPVKSDGLYDPNTHTITFNADSLANNPRSWGVIFHEALHPLFESEVANRPEISQAVDDAISRAGLDLNSAKQSYAERLINPTLDAEGVTDPAQRSQRISDYIKTMDDDSNSRNGDPNRWIRSELLSEAGRATLGTKEGMSSPTGSIADLLRPTAGGVVKNFLSKLGVNFKQKGTQLLPGGVIPEFKDVVADPSLHDTVRGLLKAQRDFKPGLSKTAEQGVALKPEDMGGPKAPFYNLPNGKVGNKYAEAVPDGKGGTKVVMRNPSSIRRAEKAEAKAMKKYMQPGTRMAKLPDAFYQDPDIGEWTKQAARAVEGASANSQPLEGWYHGIGKSGEANWKASVKKNLGNVMASHQQFYPMPEGLFISKAGNPLMDVYSLLALNRKVAQWVNRKGPLSLERWGGDVNQFRKDLETYNQNHAQGLPGDANNIGEGKRNVLNAFLYGRNAKFEEANPLRKLLRSSEDRQGIVRSLRLDRLETLQPSQSELSRPTYEKGIQNFSPPAEAADVEQETKLRPALLVDGKPLTGGNTHADILQNTVKRNPKEALSAFHAFTDDSKHVFTDQNGKVYNRDEAAKAIGVPGPLHSENIPAERKFSPQAPNDDVRKVAEDYTKSAGISAKPHQTYAALNPETSKSVADFYDKAEHKPNDPQVKASYDALKNETVAQWKAAEAAGMKFEPWTKEGQPYKTSAEMASDVKDNKHLWYFPSEAGFGEKPGDVVHPMLDKSGIKVGDKDIPVNDVFRAVHDYFGHAKEGYEFGPRGELNAFLAHSRMFSDKAQPAMAMETMGQNSWVNFGKHLRNEAGEIPAKGEPGFVKPQERPFAEQKANVLPADLLRESQKTPSPVQFSPMTETGKALEREGFHFEDEDYGGGNTTIRILNPRGDDIGHISVTQRSPTEARTDMIVLSDRYKKQGLGTALYKEIAARLQQKGVTKITGNAINADAVVPLRRKVFGNADFKETHTGLKGIRVGEVSSTIDPQRQFSPKAVIGDAAEEERPEAPKKFKPSDAAVGGKIKAYHFSDAGQNLTTLDPRYMRAKTTKFWGRQPKLFLFPEGSQNPIKHGGEGNSSFPNRDIYETTVDGDKIYDARTGKPDPLGYFDHWNTDKEQLDKVIKDAGFHGVLVSSKDGREVLVHYRRSPAKHIGVTDPEGNLKLGAKEVELPEGVTPAIRWKGKIYSKNDLDKMPGSSDVSKLENAGVLSMKDWKDVDYDDPSKPSGYLIEKGFTDSKGKWVDEDKAYQVSHSPKAEAPTEEQPSDVESARYAGRIVAATKDKGGTTFSIASKKPIGQSKVYGVSIYPDRSVILDPDDLTPERVQKFIKDNHDLLASPDNAVGTWYDKDSKKIYLDVSSAFKDRALAEYAGAKYNQKAIWDSAKGEEIPTAGTGEALEEMLPAKDRIKALKDEYELQNPKTGQQQMPGMGRVVLNPKSEEIKNVRDLEQARPNRELTPNEQAASDLARKGIRERVQLLDSADDRVKARRALLQGVSEVSDYLEKQASNKNFDSGADWYGKDIAKMEDTTKQIFPETKDPAKMTMFKLLLAAFSGGATPKENYQLASEAFATYLKTGEVPATSDFRVSETGAKKKLGRSAEMTADKLSNLLEKTGGEAGLVKYLTTKHDETIGGNKDAYGALDLGPKFGRFFLNLMGHNQEVTIDLWATRTWRRWMGTPFSRVEGEKGEQKMELANIPTDKERNLAIDAFRQIAEHMNNEIPKEAGQLTPMAVQAILWFYEKDLYAGRGVKVDRGNFSSAAAEYQKNPIHQRAKPVVTGKHAENPNQTKLL